MSSRVAPAADRRNAAVVLAVVAHASIAHAQPAPTDAPPPTAPPADAEPPPTSTDAAPTSTDAAPPTTDAAPTSTDAAPPTTEPTPPPPASTPTVAEVAPHHRPTPRPWILDRGKYYLGIELGRVDTADPTNGFSPNAYGKALVFSIKAFEMRYEAYDLEMRDPAFANAAFAKGRFTATTFAARLRFGGPIASARILLGGGYVRRPSLSSAPEDILSDTILRHQHGLAAVLGAGVQVLHFFTLEVRAYPTLWSSNQDDVRVAYVDDRPTFETLMEPVGGTPITLTAGAGISW